ncbi:MAG: hypothetical protein BGP13_01035 [Sphingobacteriales bacterium 40-81]|nr:MAG: hypothetical protein BGP13_01035 [Sphingobacteriales bacterium 40-81]
MSVWRQKAIECAPELKTEFQAVDLTPYVVFMELLPIVRQAHIDKDNDRLSKIYLFAEWCLRQNDQKLWNAIGVSFYEHLMDTPETFKQFTNWIKKDIYTDIRDLLSQRADEKQMKDLDEYYGIKKLK